MTQTSQEQYNNTPFEMTSGNCPAKELLIELVRERPCLYDKAHRSYLDSRGVKLNLWRDIATLMVEAGYHELHLTPTDVESVKKKWESMRDSFRKYELAVERASRSGSAGGKAPAKYIYYDNMLFLRLVNRRTSTLTNVSSAATNTMLSADDPSASFSNVDVYSTVEASDTSQEDSMSVSLSRASTPSGISDTQHASLDPPPVPPPSGSLRTHTSPFATFSTATTLPTPSTASASLSRTSTPPATVPSSTASAPSRGKKRKPDNRLDDVIQSQLMFTGELLQKQVADDSDSRFGQVVADQLRLLPEGRRKNELKLKVMDLLLRDEDI